MWGVLIWSKYEEMRVTIIEHLMTFSFIIIIVFTSLICLLVDGVETEQNLEKPNVGCLNNVKG